VSPILSLYLTGLSMCTRVGVKNSDMLGINRQLILERFVLGRFDILGCSHQIFHVLVVAATAVHAVGILDAYEYNRANRSCGV